VRFAAAAAAGGSITAFERECDSAAAKTVRDAKWTAFGSNVLLHYLVLLEWEQQSLRIVLLGKLAGIDQDILRSRLREL